MSEDIDQAAWWEAHKHDPELVKRAIYEAYFDLDAYDRDRSVWVMNQDTHDLLAEMLMPPPPDPPPDPPPPPGTPVTLRSSLLGLPIDIREGVEGIRLVTVMR